MACCFPSTVRRHASLYVDGGRDCLLLLGRGMLGPAALQLYVTTHQRRWVGESLPAAAAGSPTTLTRPLTLPLSTSPPVQPHPHWASQSKCGSGIIMSRSHLPSGIKALLTTVQTPTYLVRRGGGGTTSVLSGRAARHHAPPPPYTHSLQGLSSIEVHVHTSGPALAER